MILLIGSRYDPSDRVVIVRVSSQCESTLAGFCMQCTRVLYQCGRCVFFDMVPSYCSAYLLVVGGRTTCTGLGFGEEYHGQGEMVL